MKNFKLPQTVLWLWWAASSAAFSESLENLLSYPPEDYPLFNTLEREDPQDPRSPVPELALLPDMPGAGEIRTRYRALRPAVTVEQFYSLPMPHGFSAASAEDRIRLFTRMANIFGAPETQVGYTYHSYRRQRNIPLFEASYICDSRGRRQAPLQFRENQIPGIFSYKQFVDEANFSGVVMSQRLSITPDFFLFTSTNDDTLRYTIIPVLGPGEMQTELLVYPYRDRLCVYSCTEIKELRVRQIMGIVIRLDLMFEKRMQTLADWVTDQLDLEK
ncbi:MAG: hypothetical protein LBQ61_03345 [Spirochaetales bacterium]|jgi:hypothetical protein|nr:hypothetical protein [Spirochaetales bacterium]